MSDPIVPINQPVAYQAVSSTPVSQVPHGAPYVAPAGPRILTTDDEFLLIDANHDGVNDTVVVRPVETAKEKAAKADAVKFAPFHAAVNAARHEAAAAHAGQSVDQIAAAKDKAEAKVKADFKGPVPPGPVPVKVPAPAPIIVSVPVVVVP